MDRGAWWTHTHTHTHVQQQNPSCNRKPMGEYSPFLGFWKFPEVTDENWITLLPESHFLSFPERPWEQPPAP